MRVLALLALVAVVFGRNVIPANDDTQLTKKQVVPQKDAIAYGQCLSIPFQQAAYAFNAALGIDQSITWRQSNTLNRVVNNIIFNNGTQGLLAVCNARQVYAATLAASYPFCVDRYYLLSQGNTDFMNTVYYVHLFKHLEFICSTAFNEYEYNLACIKSVQSDPTYQKCFTDFTSSINTNPNGFCQSTATLTQCVKSWYNSQCGLVVGWMECERERIGFAYDCPNVVCTPGN